MHQRRDTAELLAERDWKRILPAGAAASSSPSSGEGRRAVRTMWTVSDRLLCPDHAALVGRKVKEIVERKMLPELERVPGKLARHVRIL
ncbi:hypothetical protein [Sutterella sp.]|uniref:hypothetical protein n=1 Tax=Sutterella sp. TaxID=1981025 RepID=UPI0026E0213D|nr:hypothetical protein [Sutterella sp.]MDO5532191.1 hypothetical protein [Sutterella sp.]